jgi:Tfp pilus assembly protein PilW
MRASSRKPASSPKVHMESGFSLVEFLISTLVLLLLSAAVFGMLAQTQHAAGFQAEVQAVLENTRLAMNTVDGYLRQAGNDPRGAGFQGLTIVSATEVRVRSDLTGSASASGLPDKGDPDSDTTDANEDVTVRYSAGSSTLEIVPNGGVAQPVADHISAFSMQYFDAAGASTTVGANVRKVQLTITGTTALPDPQTRQPFSMRLTSDILVCTRQ